MKVTVQYTDKTTPKTTGLYRAMPDAIRFVDVTMPQILRNGGVVSVTVEFTRKDGWQPDEVLSMCMRLSKYIYAPTRHGHCDSDYLDASFLVEYDYDTIWRTTLRA